MKMEFFSHCLRRTDQSVFGLELMQPYSVVIRSTLCDISSDAMAKDGEIKIEIICSMAKEKSLFP